MTMTDKTLDLDNRKIRYLLSTATTSSGWKIFLDNIPRLGDTSENGARVAARHLETANVLFCDGHVKAMKLGTLNETHLVGTANIRYLFTIQDD